MSTSASAILRPPDELAHGAFEMVVRRLANDLAFGADASLFVGSGLEYAQSRPYQPGDPIRQIDWRLSARTDKHFIKQYETLRRMTVYLVVDTSGSMSVSSTSLTKHDLAIWIASALGLISQRRLSPVGVVGGGQRETRVNASLSRTDLWQSLEPLRSHDPEEQTQLGTSLGLLEMHAARTSIVVVLSDLYDPDAVPALRRLAQRHDCIALRLRDPAELGHLKAGFFRGREAETGRQMIGGGRTHWDRGEVREDLIRAGVDVLELRTDQPFIAPLRHFLSARARSTR